MKHIKIYINERLHITTNTHVYLYHPKTKEELQEIIIERIKKEGNECDLNDIDVEEIKDMSHLFSTNIYKNGHKIFDDFNGDISLWDVSNVKNMGRMFYECKKFNCDLSRWNVSNVKDMNYMFALCENFNSDISQWDVSNVKNMTYMMYYCEKFNSNISKWDVSNVKRISWMFYGCTNFKQNIDYWDISDKVGMQGAFKRCPTKPKWYDKDRWEK